MITRRTLFVVVAATFAATPILAHEGHEISFPDLADYQTLVSDLHQHTVFSDGRVWPSLRVEEGLLEGIEVVNAVTAPGMHPVVQSPLEVGIPVPAPEAP